MTVRRGDRAGGARTTPGLLGTSHPPGMLDCVREGIGSTRSHPLRTALAGIAIAAAVATIALVVVAIDGVARFARANAARAFGANTFVMAKVGAPGEIDRHELEQKLRRNPDIRRNDLRFVDRYAQGRVLYGATDSRRVQVAAAGRSYEGAALVGATATLATIRDLSIERGRFFSVEEEQQAAQVTIIGATIAEELFPGVDPLEKTLRIGGRGFRVIGLQQRQGNIGGASLDRNVWVPLRVMGRLFGPPETLQILARSVGADDDLTAVEAAEDHARASMRARRQLQPGEADNFDIMSPETARDLVWVLSDRIGMAAGPISAMALVAAFVVVTNTILVSVTQRTREIGIRRAIGATRSHIMVEVLAESLAVALLGGLVGIGSVYALVEAVGGLGVELRLQLTTVAWSLAAATGSGLLAGWYPALRATRIDVVEALRSE